jgi:glucose/arabinose dehydrogenase
MRVRLVSLLLLLCSARPAQLAAQMTPHTLAYAPGKSITLSLPSGLNINVAARGLHRVRFFAQAPDGRIFVTGMYNLADNSRGSVFLLDGWNAQTHTFARVDHYLDHLRNPNNLAFYTDARGQSWMYLPLTDKLLRYRYNAGDMHPSGPPEVLIRFPDYGLNYKYGGWHLTRTVAIATLHSQARVYVTAGSSCNYCQEREVLRAALVSMNPDGSGQQVLAHGLRNAVDLKFVPDVDGGALFASNMGDDHLGDKLPEDTFFELDSRTHLGPIAYSVPANCGDNAACVAAVVPNYGWPTCYFANGKPVHDTTPLPAMPTPGDPATEAERPTPAKAAVAPDDSVYGAYGTQKGIAAAGTNLSAGGNSSQPDPNAGLGNAPPPLSDCRNVPAAYTTFAAHSSPLGLAYFGADNPQLHGSFLVALHGAGHPRIGTGYRLVRFTPGDRTPRDFMSGFLTFANGRPIVHGRPCGLLRVGPDSFLLTDDFLGLVYFIGPQT